MRVKLTSKSEVVVTEHESYLCDDCDLEFTNKSGCENHWNLHHTWVKSADIGEHAFYFFNDEAKFNRWRMAKAVWRSEWAGPTWYTYVETYVPGEENESRNIYSIKDFRQAQNDKIQELQEQIDASKSLSAELDELLTEV
jgi:hypothetical protein